MIYRRRLSCRKRAKRWRVHIRLYCERGVQVRASDEWRWLVRGGDDGREVANRAKHTGTINVAWYTASLEFDALEPTAPRRGVRSGRSACPCPSNPNGRAHVYEISAPTSIFPAPFGPPQPWTGAHVPRNPFSLDPAAAVAAEVALSPAQPVLSRYQTSCCCCSCPCFFRPVLIIHSCFR